MISAAIVAVWAAVFVWLGGTYQRYLAAELEAEASSLAGSYATSLSNALNGRTALVRGLAAYVSSQLVEHDAAPEQVMALFPFFASALIPSTPGIRNVALAPDFVVRAVYPYAANQALLGLDLRDRRRPDIAESVDRAVASGEVALQGPVALVQGGTGIIGRQVVYNDGRPWGVVNIVFDLPPLLDEAGLSQRSQSLRMALLDGKGALITGDATVPDSSPVRAKVQVADSAWELAVAPADGWGGATLKGFPRQILLTSFTLIVLATVGGVWLAVQRRVELGALVAERSKDLLAKNRELERFAEVTAHDLQEPVRRIASYAQLIGRDSTDPAERVLYCGFLSDDATRLRDMLRDIQFYVAVEQLPKPKAPVPAGEVAAEATKRLARRISAAGATVSIGTLPEVMCDRVSLRHILQILLDNALEYRDPTKALQISISGTSVPAGVQLTVADNGIGIEPQYHDRIFEIFQRLHTRDEHAGNGMGLAIVRKLIERLGGRVWVEAALGVGSRFHLVMPARPAGRTL